MANAAVAPSPCRARSGGLANRRRSARRSPYQGIPRTKRAPKRALVRPSRYRGEVQGSGFQGTPVVAVCPERLHQHTPAPSPDDQSERTPVEARRDVHPERSPTEAKRYERRDRAPIEVRPEDFKRLVEGGRYERLDRAQGEASWDE